MFCVTLSTAVFTSLSTVCQYLTMYHTLVLYHYVHLSFLHSVHRLSVPHALPSVGSVSVCPMLSSTVSPISVNTSHDIFCFLCFTMFTAVFSIVSTVCYYPTLYLLFVKYHYVHYTFLYSLHCLSIPHTLPTFCSVPLCPLLSPIVCPISVWA